MYSQQNLQIQGFHKGMKTHEFKHCFMYVEAQKIPGQLQKTPKGAR